MKVILKSLLVAALLSVGASNVIAQESQEVKYQGEFNISTAICAAEDIQNPFNFETIHGIRVNKHISVGVGLGFNLFREKWYNDDFKNSFIIPLFVDVKWYILDRKISPYVSLDMGYNFGVGNKYGGCAGMYTAPGAGVSFKLKGKGAFNLGLALKNNALDARGYDEENLTSLAFKAAIVF